MIEISNKSLCCGCSACTQICPTHCIEMVSDEEGFWYPCVDKEKCINCHQCEKKCPILTTSFVPKQGFPDAYLVYDKKMKWRQNSAAGGAFTAIARCFLSGENTVVYGATYDNDYSVHHERITQIGELPRLQKSKYVQSEIRNTYQEVKLDLKMGKKVLFSGTPCQIYGLKSFLGNCMNIEKLTTVDLSCHGVPSPKVFKLYLKSLEKRENSKIASFTMRAKQLKGTYYKQGFNIVFANGKQIFNSHTHDLFARCFWGEIASRPSCYNCHFKTVWRVADITLADCWFFHEFVPEEFDSAGVTLMLVHSEKGKEILNTCTDLIKYSVDSEKLIKANGGMLYSSAVPHKRRKEFFERIQSEEFDKVVDDILPEKNEGKLKKMIQPLWDRNLFFTKVIKRYKSRKRLEERLVRNIPEAARGEMR